MVIFRYNILVVKIVYWGFSEGHSVKWVFCRILFCIEGYVHRYYESAWCSWWVVFGVVVSCVVAYIVVSCYRVQCWCGLVVCPQYVMSVIVSRSCQKQRFCILCFIISKCFYKISKVFVSILINSCEVSIISHLVFYVEFVFRSFIICSY